VDQVHELEEVQLEGRAWTWTVRILYTTLIAAELWVLYDWWRETPTGAATLTRWRQWYETAKRKAEECEGCAKRRAAIQAAVNRMHWQARQIVEGEDVPTEPES
jgi:hypothetical protein